MNVDVENSREQQICSPMWLLARNKACVAEQLRMPESAPEKNTNYPYKPSCIRQNRPELSKRPKFELSAFAAIPAGWRRPHQQLNCMKDWIWFKGDREEARKCLHRLMVCRNHEVGYGLGFRF